MRAYIGYFDRKDVRRIFVGTNYLQARRLTAGGVVEIELDERYLKDCKNGSYVGEKDKGFKMLAEILTRNAIIPYGIILGN